MPELRSDERRLIVELMIKIPELINGTKPTAATTSSEPRPDQIGGRTDRKGISLMGPQEVNMENASPADNSYVIDVANHSFNWYRTPQYAQDASIGSLRCPLSSSQRSCP
jgi:hypothetical protein